MVANSLYLGFEYKSGYEYGTTKNALVLKFRHEGKELHEIFYYAYYEPPCQEMFDRIGSICLEKIVDENRTTFRFHPNANGSTGWYFGK